MKVDIIILLGGFGTRLKDITKNKPKALMPIGDKKFLDYLVKKIMNYNINKIYLSLFYKSDLFIDYINQTNFAIELIPIIEPNPMGTGGAINYIISNSSISNTFIVVNGDSLSKINLNEMLTSYEKNKFSAMIGLSKVIDSSRYGNVISRKQKVLSFEEKNSSRSGWINNGHYIFNKNIFNSWSSSFSLEKELFPLMIKDNSLGAFKVRNDKFIDMGIPADYVKLCKNIKEYE